MAQWVTRNISTVALSVLFVSAVAISIWLLAPALSLPSGPGTGVPTFAAALAVTGALVTAGVTLVGIILEQSRESRAARLAEAADARAALEQQRLQMQAALETVRLLSTNDGKPAPATQVSAALIVLSKLGETRLAIDLAAEFWPASQVTASAIVYLCDAAFGTEDDATQVSAAILLSANWPGLRASDERVHWPSFTEGWPDTLCPEARTLLARTLRQWIEEAPADEPDFRKALVKEADRLSVATAQKLLGGERVAIQS